MNTSVHLQEVKAMLPAGCQLIAVTKTHGIDKIMEAYNAGHRVFGENRVQELLPKYEALPKDIQWHLIGHLQTNKVKYIAPFITCIHSVDSMRLLEEINRQGERHKRKINCLLQVHVAVEETKFGFSPDEALQLLENKKLDDLHNVAIRGLMAMASFTENRDQVRREFQSVSSLFRQVKQATLPPNVVMKELSIGMSSDFEIAVQEGSTMVRVGSRIFGERPMQQT